MEFLANYTYAIFVFARVLGMFLIAPVFGSRNFPRQAKIGFVFFLTMIMMPNVQISESMDLSHLSSLFIYIANEMLIGFSIGTVASIFMNFVYTAGNLIDRNLGFSMVSVISPMDESQMPITSNLFYLFVTLIFLTTNMHHMLLEGIYHSFVEVPIGSFFNVFIVNHLVEILQISFVIGLQISAPFIIVIMVANIILGLLSKAMPGMNVFMVGMPFKILIGLTLLLVLMPYYSNAFTNILEMMFSHIDRLINMLAG